MSGWHIETLAWRNATAGWCSATRQWRSETIAWCAPSAACDTCTAGVRTVPTGWRVALNARTAAPPASPTPTSNDYSPTTMIPGVAKQLRIVTIHMRNATFHIHSAAGPWIGKSATRAPFDV